MSPRFEKSPRSPKSTFVGPDRPFADPNWSYALRFSSSESTS